MCLKFDIVCFSVYAKINVHEAANTNKIKLHISRSIPGLKDRKQSLYTIYTTFIEQGKKTDKAITWSSKVMVRKISLEKSKSYRERINHRIGDAKTK